MPSTSLNEFLEKRSKAYAGQLKAAHETQSLPDGVRHYLNSHAILPSIAEKYSLGYVGEPLRGDERYAGRLSIPYITRSGVRAIRFRDTSGLEGEQKIAQDDGQANRIYNSLSFFAAGTRIGITEGEIDAINATEHLGVPSVGIPGANGWKDPWQHAFEDYAEILIFADGDKPGREFAERLRLKLLGVRIVYCPDDQDVSSMCAAGRAAELIPEDDE